MYYQMYCDGYNANHMKVNRFLTASVAMQMLLLIGCGSDPATVTKPRTKAECDGLFERAEGWLDGIPGFGEEDREERRRNVCKNAFAYEKGTKLQIEAVKCYLDLNGDTMTRKNKTAMVGIIKTYEQSIKDSKEYASQISTCPELGD